MRDTNAAGGVTRGPRRLTYDQLIRMTDEEVASYWYDGLLPDDIELRTIVTPTVQGRSMLEAAERAWARRGGE